MSKDLKRVCLVLNNHHHDQLLSRGVNISSLIRDLIDDYLSEDKITLSVSKETHKLYDTILINSGSSDTNFEPYVVQALHKFLEDKIERMKELNESF